MSSNAGQFSKLLQILKSIYEGKLFLAKNSHIFDGKIYLSEEERLEHLNSWYTTKVHSQKLVDEAITETVKLITGPDVSESCKLLILSARPRDISLSSYLQNFREYFKADGSCFLIVFMRLVDACLFQAKFVSKADRRFSKMIKSYVEFFESELKIMQQYPCPVALNRLDEQTRFLFHNLKIIRVVNDIEMEYSNKVRMLPGKVKGKKQAIDLPYPFSNKIFE